MLLKIKKIIKKAYTNTIIFISSQKITEDKDKSPHISLTELITGEEMEKG